VVVVDLVGLLAQVEVLCGAVRQLDCRRESKSSSSNRAAVVRGLGMLDAGRPMKTHMQAYRSSEKVVFLAAFAVSPVTQCACRDRNKYVPSNDSTARRIQFAVCCKIPRPASVPCKKRGSAYLCA
jgi:hypothetical protein